MDEIKINFASPPPRTTVRTVAKVCAAIALALGVVVLIATTGNGSEQIILGGLREIPFVRQVAKLIGSADRPLSGATDDRVNVLLLGIGGAGHDGPLLTDTIILASIKPSTHQVALISIPRDLAVPIPGRGWAKLNSANAYGEETGNGNGAELARNVISDALKQPIPYYIRIDFRGFERLINQLGGVDVTVERNFIDTTYPIDETGNVTTISFIKGYQHMDGATALQFARSRHGTNGEGSDFARAHRQQQILLAVKAKVFSLGTLSSPTRISEILNAVRSHVATNFSAWELPALAREASSIDTSRLKTAVLDDRPNGLLVDTIGVDGAFLLSPRDNNWVAVQAFVANMFAAPSVEEAIKTPEPVRVEIQNGTHLTGLASRAATTLETQSGFTVTQWGNALNRERSVTTIIDYTNGNKAEALKTLLTLFPGTVIRGSSSLPISPPVGSPTSATTPKPDFLLILGTDTRT